MTKTFNDGQQFRDQIYQHIQYGDSNTDSPDFSAKALSTNIGLYIGLTKYLTGLYASLNSIRDLGNELVSEDEQSAQLSKAKFKQAFSHSKMQILRNKPTDKHIRQYFLKVLRQSKYLYYHVTDKANPAYHNKKYDLAILIVDNHKIYTNALFGYSQSVQFYKDICKEAKDIKWAKQSKSRIKKYLSKSSSSLDKRIKETYIKDPAKLRKSKNSSKKDVDKFNKVIHNLLKQHNITHYNKLKIVVNPNGSNDTDMPRIMKINHNIFHYDPKKVDKKYIIYDNIPHLGKGIDNDDVDVFRANSHVIEEY